MRVHLRLIFTYLSAALSFDPIPSLIIEGDDATSVYGTSPPVVLRYQRIVSFIPLLCLTLEEPGIITKGRFFFWILLAKFVLCLLLLSHALYGLRTASHDTPSAINPARFSFFHALALISIFLRLRHAFDYFILYYLPGFPTSRSIPVILGIFTLAYR
jgi:hypothetical protein